MRLTFKYGSVSFFFCNFFWKCEGQCTFYTEKFSLSVRILVSQKLFKNTSPAKGGEPGFASEIIIADQDETEGLF